MKTYCIIGAYEYNGSARDAIVEYFCMQGVDGLVVVDHRGQRPASDEIGNADAWMYLCSAACSAGMEVIFQYHELPRSIDQRRIEKIVSTGCGKISIGSAETTEWVGSHELAEEYIEIGKRMGFEWVCGITPRTILMDLLTRERREVLVRNNVLCLTLSPYILWGYMFADERFPHQWETTLAGKNLHVEYGLTPERLADYVEPLDIMAGVGSQVGLDAGSAVYAKMLNFKGLVISLPFDLTGVFDTSVRMSPPGSYPTICGNFEEGGYRNAYA